MRKSNTQHIGDILEEYIDALKLRGKMRKYKVTKIWPQVMGPSIAKCTKSIFFKERVLFVTLNNPVLRSELHMSKSKIIEILNKEVGAEIVEDIVFR